MMIGRAPNLSRTSCTLHEAQFYDPRLGVPMALPQQDAGDEPYHTLKKWLDRVVVAGIQCVQVWARAHMFIRYGTVVAGGPA